MSFNNNLRNMNMGGGANGTGGNQKITADQAKDYMKTKVMVVGDNDREIWRLMTEVPNVNKFVAIFFAILNVILPGFGTMFAACFTSDPDVSKA